MSKLQKYQSEYGIVPGMTGKEWFKANKQEMLAGLTTSLTVVPTTIAFAFLGEISPEVGLTGTWLIALILAVAGGCPGMIYCSECFVVLGRV